MRINICNTPSRFHINEPLTQFITSVPTDNKIRPIMSLCNYKRALTSRGQWRHTQPWAQAELNTAYIYIQTPEHASPPHFTKCFGPTRYYKINFSITILYLYFYNFEKYVYSIYAESNLFYLPRILLWYLSKQVAEGCLVKFNRYSHLIFNVELWVT